MRIFEVVKDRKEKNDFSTVFVFLLNKNYFD